MTPFGVAHLGQVRMMTHRPAAGTIGVRWWSHHIANTRAYLEASLAGDTESALGALKELWDAVLQWQNITGSWAAGVLMAEHTALAKMLVDGFAQKAGPAWTSSAAAALGKNVESHAKLFPKDPAAFAELFGEHTRLAGEYITDLAEGRQKDFQEHFADAIRNGRDLAKFTDAAFASARPI